MSGKCAYCTHETHLRCKECQGIFVCSDLCRAAIEPQHAQLCLQAKSKILKNTPATEPAFRFPRDKKPKYKPAMPKSKQRQAKPSTKQFSVENFNAEFNQIHNDLMATHLVKSEEMTELTATIESVESQLLGLTAELSRREQLVIFGANEKIDDLMDRLHMTTPLEDFRPAVELENAARVEYIQIIKQAAYDISNLTPEEEKPWYSDDALNQMIVKRAAVMNKFYFSQGPSSDLEEVRDVMIEGKRDREPSKAETKRRKIEPAQKIDYRVQEAIKHTRMTAEIMKMRHGMSEVMGIRNSTTGQTYYIEGEDRYQFYYLKARDLVQPLYDVKIPNIYTDSPLEQMLQQPVSISGPETMGISSPPKIELYKDWLSAVQGRDASVYDDLVALKMGGDNDFSYPVRSEKSVQQPDVYDAQFVEKSTENIASRIGSAIALFNRDLEKMKMGKLLREREFYELLQIVRKDMKQSYSPEAHDRARKLRKLQDILVVYSNSIARTTIVIEDLEASRRSALQRLGSLGTYALENALGHPVMLMAISYFSSYTIARLPGHMVELIKKVKEWAIINNKLTDDPKADFAIIGGISFLAFAAAFGVMYVGIEPILKSAYHLTKKIVTVGVNVSGGILGALFAKIAERFATAQAVETRHASNLKTHLCAVQEVFSSSSAIVQERAMRSQELVKTFMEMASNGLINKMSDANLGSYIAATSYVMAARDAKTIGDLPKTYVETLQTTAKLVGLNPSNQDMRVLASLPSSDGIPALIANSDVPKASGGFTSVMPMNEASGFTPVPASLRVIRMTGSNKAISSLEEAAVALNVPLKAIEDMTISKASTPSTLILERAKYSPATEMLDSYDIPTMVPAIPSELFPNLSNDEIAKVIQYFPEVLTEERFVGLTTAEVDVFKSFVTLVVRSENPRGVLQNVGYGRLFQLNDLPLLDQRIAEYVNAFRENYGQKIDPLKEEIDENIKKFAEVNATLTEALNRMMEKTGIANFTYPIEKLAPVSGKMFRLHLFTVFRERFGEAFAQRLNETDDISKIIDIFSDLRPEFVQEVIAEARQRWLLAGGFDIFENEMGPYMNFGFYNFEEPFTMDMAEAAQNQGPLWSLANAWLQVKKLICKIGAFFQIVGNALGMVGSAITTSVELLVKAIMKLFRRSSKKIEDDESYQAREEDRKALATLMAAEKTKKLSVVDQARKEAIMKRMQGRVEQEKEDAVRNQMKEYQTLCQDIIDADNRRADKAARTLMDLFKATTSFFFAVARDSAFEASIWVNGAFVFSWAASFMSSTWAWFFPSTAVVAVVGPAPPSLLYTLAVPVLDFLGLGMVWPTLQTILIVGGVVVSLGALYYILSRIFSRSNVIAMMEAPRKLLGPFETFKSFWRYVMLFQTGYQFYKGLSQAEQATQSQAVAEFMYSDKRPRLLSLAAQPGKATEAAIVLDEILEPHGLSSKVLEGTFEKDIINAAQEIGSDLRKWNEELTKTIATRTNITVRVTALEEEAKTLRNITITSGTVLDDLLKGNVESNITGAPAPAPAFEKAVEQTIEANSDVLSNAVVGTAGVAAVVGSLVAAKKIYETRSNANQQKKREAKMKEEQEKNERLAELRRARQATAE